jgi:hypothetical protein
VQHWKRMWKGIMRRWGGDDGDVGMEEKALEATYAADMGLEDVVEAPPAEDALNLQAMINRNTAPIDNPNSVLPVQTNATNPVPIGEQNTIQNPNPALPVTPSRTECSSYGRTEHSSSKSSTSSKSGSERQPKSYKCLSKCLSKCSNKHRPSSPRRSRTTTALPRKTQKAV